MQETQTMTVPLAEALASEAGQRANDVARMLRAPELTVDEIVRAVRVLDECRDRAAAAQQEMVTALRESGLTWQRVGELLGITRQSAWQRWQGGGSPHGRRT